MRKGVAVLLAVVSIFILTTTGLAGGFEGYVTASTLYVREQPFSESDTIHFVRNGEKVSISKKVNEWYHVTCANGIEGYVYAQFIRIEGTDSSSVTESKAVSTTITNSTASSKPALSSASAQTGVGSKATMVSAGFSSNTTMGAQGDNVTTIQQALDGLGYDTGEIDGIFGPVTYQAVKAFQKDNGLVVDGIVGKATMSVLFGDTPATKQAASSAGSQTAQGGSKIPLIPTSIATNTPDTKSQNNQEASNTSSNQSSTSTASGSGTSAAAASVADTKTSAAPTSGSVASAASTSGGSSSAVSASGTSASAASGSKTKSLDWYGEGYSLINKNKNITVYDLNTGVVWGAKYINGKNHADIIPASSSDAKKIASGNITGSYVRRPVVVSIAGVNYAGSMYAVGHGETSYCDYFKGVMCIHFTGSQTHGTQKVDADHQKAIEVALKATVTR